MKNSSREFSSQLLMRSGDFIKGSFTKNGFAGIRKVSDESLGRDETPRHNQPRNLDTDIDTDTDDDDDDDDDGDGGGGGDLYSCLGSLLDLELLMRKDTVSIFKSFLEMSCLKLKDCVPTRCTQCTLPKPADFWSAAKFSASLVIPCPGYSPDSGGVSAARNLHLISDHAIWHL